MGFGGSAPAPRQRLDVQLRATIASRSVGDRNIIGFSMDALFPREQALRRCSLGNMESMTWIHHRHLASIRVTRMESPRAAWTSARTDGLGRAAQRSARRLHHVGGIREE